MTVEARPLEMSGLKHLGAIRDGRLPAPPIAELLGLELVEVGHAPMTSDTGKVLCEVSTVHAGGRVATAEGRVFSARASKLIATATCSCVILKAEG